MELKRIGFRVTPERREKVLLLAKGQGITVTEVLNKLIDRAPVKRVEGYTFVDEPEKADNGA